MGDPWGPRFALVNEGLQIPFHWVGGHSLAYRFGGGFRSALITHIMPLYMYIVEIVKIWSRDHELTGSEKNLSLVLPWHKFQLATGHWFAVAAKQGTCNILTSVQLRLGTSLPTSSTSSPRIICIMDVLWDGCWFSALFLWSSATVAFDLISASSSNYKAAELNSMKCLLIFPPSIYPLTTKNSVSIPARR